MKNILTVIEICLGALTAILILLQHRASGLSAAFGGSGSTYVQRRGAEKVLFTFTVWTVAAFLIVALVMMYS